MSEKDPSLTKPSKANLSPSQGEVERSLIERTKALSSGVLDAMGIEVSEDTGAATISYRAGYIGGELAPFATTGGAPVSRSATEKKAKLVVRPDKSISVTLHDIHHSRSGDEYVKKSGDDTTFGLDEEGGLIHRTHFVDSENPTDEIVADLKWLGVFEGQQPTVSFSPPQQ